MLPQCLEMYLEEMTTLSKPMTMRSETQSQKYPRSHHQAFQSKSSPVTRQDFTEES